MGVASGRSVFWLGLLIAFGLSAPAFAEEGALLSCPIKGNISEADQKLLIGTLESSLASGKTPKVLSLADTQAKVSAMAPEVMGCFTSSCLTRAGQALSLPVAYLAEVEEDFEIYEIRVRVVDLLKGEVLHESNGSCEICTLDEALETMKNTASAATTGWEMPKEEAPVVEKVEPDPVVEPKPEVKDEHVKVAIYTNPADAEIFVDGEPRGAGELVGTLAIGVHDIEVRREGYSTVTESVKLKKGDGPTYLVLHLKPTEALAPVAGRSGGLVEGMDRELWAWGLTGGGAILTVGGAVLLGIDGEPSCSGDVTSCPDLIETTAGGSIMTILGAATLASGIALFLWDDLAGTADEGEEGLSLGLTPGGMVLSGRF